MSINKQLKELYESCWKDLNQYGKKISSIKPANPLLLKIIEEEYEQADLKVMIFGQETWGWHEFSTSIEEGMNRYENFFVTNFTQGKKKGAFRQAFNYFKTELNNHFKDKKIYYVWNNISKIGRNDKKTGVTTDIRNLERNHFNVIAKEVSILKPDIIIFLTGNRDDDIRFNFPGAEFENIHYDASLKSKNGNRKYKMPKKIIQKNLPKNKSVKLYHPSFFGGFNNVKSDVVKFIVENTKYQT